MTTRHPSNPGMALRLFGVALAIGALGYLIVFRPVLVERGNVKRLQDPNPVVRLKALKALAAQGLEKEHFSAVARLIEDPDPSVREAAALVALKIDNTYSSVTLEPTLQRLIDDPSPEFRTLAAMLYIGHQRVDTAELLIRKLVSETNSDVQEMIAKTLGEYGQELLMAPLMEAFRRSDNDRLTQLVADVISSKPNILVDAARRETQQSMMDKFLEVSHRAKSPAFKHDNVESALRDLRSEDFRNVVWAANRLAETSWIPGNREDHARYLFAMKQWDLLPAFQQDIQQVLRQFLDRSELFGAYRQGAIELLLGFHDQTGNEWLREIMLRDLRDGSFSARREAYPILRALGWQPATQEEQVLRMIAEDDWEALVHVGEPAVAELFEVFAKLSFDDRHRPNFQEVFERIGQPSVSYIRGVLREDATFFEDRKDAAIQLTKNLHLVEALPELVSLFLNTEDFGVRKESRDILIGMGTAVTPVLLGALETEKGQVRRDADDLSRVLYVIGDIGDPKALDYVLSVYSTWNTRLHAPIAYALGELGVKTSRVSSILYELIKSEDAHVRASAFGALGPVEGESALPVLQEALDDLEYSVRLAAAGSLSKVPHALSVKERVHIDVLTDNWDELVALGNEAVPHLRSILSSTGAKKHAPSIQALGRIGGDDSATVVTEYLKFWDLHKIVLSALGVMAWQPKTDEEKVHVWVAQRDKQSLHNNFDMVKEVLLKDVESSQREPIENALYAFIGIGNEEVIPALEEKLRQKGTVEMAEAYLNCGHKGLQAAARQWALDHGYPVSEGPGAHPVGWGRL